MKGNVTSKTDGQPIIGASVIETISTTNGTITDFDGNFTLSVPTNATLKISYIGYKPVTVKAAASIQVLLEEDTQMVDEVVVTGYTTQRKADLTGAVSVVKVDEIQKQGENNPVKALQGRVPGMNITADGNPSGTATVRIRGIGTLNNNDPLYIIDGVPSKAGMHELNGNDIESIQVLKDAASASIYGSRAANGVIIITTKQGRKGQIKINFDASVSASMYQSKLDMMNTEQYGRTLWQANVNSGKNPNANSIGYQYDWGYNAEGYPVLDNIYVPKFIDDANTIATGDTDWFDEITRTGFIQQYNLSLSNGTERGNYFFSLGYYKNDGLIKYTNFDRISARINSDYKVIDNILTIGEHFTLNRTTEVQAPGNIMSDAMIALPMIPVHTVDGTNWGGPNSTMPDRQNVARIIYDNRNNRYTYWRLFGDAYVNLNPVKGLNIRSTFGLDYAQKYQRNFTLPYNTGFLNSDKDAVEMKQEHFTKWMWNAVATYELEIGKHRGDVMAGMELNREDDINFAAYREGFAILTPDYMYPSAGVGQSQASGGAGGFSLVSFFGKLNYSYADKYLLSFTLRRDGSSRFGSNNKYATFPSVSLGWRISQEAFMEKTKDVIDDLKIRAAWGQTGNQDIENYARYSIYESKYGTGNPPTYGTSYDITGSNGGSLLPSGFVRTQIGNDDIKWETTTQTNVGMDFSLFNQTLYGSAEYYYKKTTDILIKPSYIGILGEGGGQWRNAGSMENKGFEFNLGYRNKTAFGLSYDINANLGLYRNKILFVPGEVASTGDFGGDG
ncbi:SusC/RagA family TonB-linked outer membrane protein [Bacteroides finegoldii DSM 17565]|nr:SusC/RagA family TonB-linked outer membrane protein [Bacteroides finegoldii DSM 17565]